LQVQILPPRQITLIAQENGQTANDGGFVASPRQLRDAIPEQVGGAEVGVGGVGVALRHLEGRVTGMLGAVTGPASTTGRVTLFQTVAASRRLGGVAPPQAQIAQLDE
jgi:hypothetical protein